MKSATATKILYEDPNSFFRASRTVALRDLVGSTLKSIKPRPMDTKLEMISSTKITELVNNLDAIDTRLKFISQHTVVANFNFGTIETSAREILKFMGVCNSLMRQLKPAATILPQEELQQIYSFTQSIYDSLDSIVLDISQNEANEAFIQSSTINKLVEFVGRFIGSLQQFMKLKNISGGDFATELFPDPILPPQYPDEIPEPEGPIGDDDEIIGGRRGFGADTGHFRVLSDRFRQIQKAPYKRFI